MSQTLIERIKKARQTSVQVGKFTLICRRPTDLEMLEMRTGKVTQSEILTRFVDGWDGFKEIDLVPGGTDIAVAFTPELFAEWVADHPDCWGAISDAVVQGYKLHEAALEAAAKN